MKLIKKIFYVGLPIVLGSIVGLLIRTHIDYQYLIKPILSPQPILFPIIWSVIYILMGISYFIYKSDTGLDNIDILYYIQLFTNLMWPILFFITKLYLISTIWIIILDILLIILLRIMFKYNPKSGYLNIPYLIWNIFATYLTFSIYLLN